MRNIDMQSMALVQESGWREILSSYYELTKPGITLMVVVSAAAGFYLSLPKNTFLYLTMAYAVRFGLAMVGTALVSAGACALNHVMEHRFDADMKRTMHRPIPAGRIQPVQATVFGVVLAVSGVALLVPLNFLGAILAALTVFLYLAVYTPLKRRTPLSTLVGGIPGALPPLGGWVLGSGEVGAGGIVLFFILFLWQIPHFLSLAWMYRKDYERGGFPMLTVKDDSGLLVARHILVYSLLLLVLSLVLTVEGLTGRLYFFGALGLGLAFIAACVRFFLNRTSVNARGVLLSSYLYLLSMFTLMFLDKA